MEKNLNETTPPAEPSMNEQQAEDVEKQLAEPTPKQASAEPERSEPLAEPGRTEPIEVQEEPQRVQQAIHAEIEVSPLEVTSVYRRSRSSFCLP